jgi:hypothetical protein
LLVLGWVATVGSTEPVVPASAMVPYSSSTGNLITHVLPSEGGGPQAIAVVDPGQRVLAVYHVDKSTGEIALCSVRNITWDLQMPEFNSGKPLPRDIRNMRNELQR